MKKTALMIALLAVFLSACTSKGKTEATESISQTVQPELSAVESFSWDTHRAFQKALTQIHDELYWPELQYERRIEVHEPGTIEDEQFAIFDVDGDGEDELLVSIFNTFTAGMCEVIYGYDAGKDGVRVEAQTYVGVAHYPGILRVSLPHNQGNAGDVLWPYQVLVYEEEEDAYREICSVDAWNKEISDYDSYLDMPYPEEIDTEKDGFVYLITENGELTILNRGDYEAWESALFSGKEELIVPWQKITAENIGLESQEHPIVLPGNLLHQTDFTLCAGKVGTVELYGKKSDGYYRVSYVGVRLEDSTLIPLSVQDGLAKYWGQDGISDTESWAADSGLVLEDVNFDGYTDIGLQIQVTAYNSPYVYWYYDPDSAAYRVLGSFLCPLTVDPIAERCTEEYRDGQTYYKEIYKAQGPLLELEERWITEYVDGQSVTRKETPAG